MRIRTVATPKRSAILIVTLLASLAACGGAGTPEIKVTGPTIVGFFPPLSNEELQQTPAVAEGLAHLQFALNDAEECLAALAPTVRLEAANTLKFRIDGKVQTLEIPQVDGLWIGAVLLQPGQEYMLIHAEAGPAQMVHVLPAAAAEYFSAPECDPGS